MGDIGCTTRSLRYTPDHPAAEERASDEQRQADRDADQDVMPAEQSARQSPHPQRT